MLPGCAPGTFVLVMDADTVLGPDFVASALAALADPMVGAVGGIFRGRHPGNLLEVLQCNEYDRCARQVGRRGGKAFVLTGTATLFRVEVLQALVAQRGYVYETASRTEDNEVTLAVRRLGWRAVSPKACVVHTELMAELGSLWRQRYRWYRGAVEDLRRCGWTTITAPYILRQAMLAVSVVMCAMYVLVTAASHTLRFVWPWSLIWATVTAVFMLERVVTVRLGGWRVMVLAAVLLPEFVYSTILQAVYVTAVTAAFLRPDAERAGDMYHPPSSRPYSASLSREVAWPQLAFRCSGGWSPPSPFSWPASPCCTCAPNANAEPTAGSPLPPRTPVGPPPSSRFASRSPCGR